MIVPPPIARLVITGATGWLGRATLALARRWWGSEADARVRAYGSRGGGVEVPGGDFLLRPLAELPGADIEGATVVHLAFVTKDRLAGSSDGDLVSRNVEIDDLVIAACLRSVPAGVFVTSSGAAHLAQDGAGDLYGLTKLMQEERFGRLAAETGVPMLRGRLWSVAGPYINKPDAYALASFLLQARRERRVTVKAASPVYRSYVHVEDLMTVGFAALAAGRAPGEVIDLAGAEVLEMGDVAREAALAAGLDEAAVERGAITFERRSVYVGEPTAFRDLALAAGLRPRSFPEQVRDTLAYLDGVTGA